MDDPVSPSKSPASPTLAPPVEPPVATPLDPYAVLRIKSFREYLSGWMLMVLGGQIQSAAVGWEVYKRTSDPFQLALVGLVQAIPILVFSLPAGAWADHFNRKQIVMISAMGTAIASLMLALCSWTVAPLYLVYLALFLSNTAQAVGRPARQAIVPAIVPSHLFANAMTWNSSIFQMSSMVGPAIAGLVLTISPMASYIAYAGLTFVFAVQLARIKGNFIPKPRPAGQEISQLQALSEGASFVFSTKIIFATILLDLMAVLLGGAAYLLPIFATDILKTNAFGFGLLRGAEAVGSLAMGLIVAHMPPFKRAGTTMMWAVAGFGASVILFGYSKNFYLSLFALVLMGAFDNVSVIVRHTLVSLLAPDQMRGRVNAINTIFIGSSNELGGFRAGSMAKMFGPVESVVIGGLGTLASVAFIALKYPQVKKLGSLADIKAEGT